jgi:enterochelin esterase-like enzyme
MALFLGAGRDDGHFLVATQQFNDEVASLHWPVYHLDIVNGGHDQACWRLQMVHTLNWLGSLWPNTASSGSHHG